MLDKIERRLVLMHISVFAFVLCVLSVCVLVYFQYSLRTGVRAELSRLADSVISSIDYYDESGHVEEGKPDSIASVLPDDATQSLSAMKLQWFDRNGRLRADKGHLSIVLPFAPDVGFQEQRQPHALLLTRPAIIKGTVLGYVRIAHPLVFEDHTFQILLIAVVVGISISLLATAVGITWLVSQSMMPIVEMIARLKQFTADASHELRNPLMIIKTNVDVALKYSDGMRPSDREKFATVQFATNMMSQMSQDLLLLSRIDDQSEREGGEELVNIADVCRRVGMRWASSTHGIDLETLLPQHLFTTGREIDLERVFENIISNAFQYSGSGGSVTIEGQISADRIKVNVRDTGIGIDPADLPRIFDRFWRADKARNIRESGSGLGLAICKSIVESYGGSISVQSKPGGGSMFTVVLPKAVELQPTSLYK